jgi:TnpA family transposase
LEDQEATMLGLHLLQNCMVYINTLMLQRVLGVLRDNLDEKERQSG